MMSSYVHYKLLTDASYTSVCDVNATISCTQAYLSRYGSLWGVPVALGGVLFFAMVLAIAGLAGRPGAKARENAPGVHLRALDARPGLRPLSRHGRRTSCSRPSASSVRSPTSSVIAIFIISGGATTFPMKTLPDRARRDIRTLVSSPLALVIALALRRRRRPSLLRAFPREAARAAQQRRPGAGAAAAGHRRAARQARPVVGGPAEGRGAGAGRRRQGADRQVQRLPVPRLQDRPSRPTSRSCRSTSPAGR